MFTVDDRDHVRDYVLQLAASDDRVVAGAVIGSLAFDKGDRWSDLDLTFAVADDVPVSDVLENWSHKIVSEFGAAHLFDMPSGASIYRVFLLPGSLQFDLSFTPASKFGARGPNFRILFGTAVELPHVQSPPAHELFGHAVHHVLRARFCIERGRYWQAEYWISATRDLVFSLACHRSNLSVFHGRGYDDLPPGTGAQLKNALVRTLDREELLRALGSVVDGLLDETDEVAELAEQMEPQLRRLVATWE